MRSHSFRTWTLAVGGGWGALLLAACTCYGDDQATARQVLERLERLEREVGSLREENAELRNALREARPAPPPTANAPADRGDAKPLTGKDVRTIAAEYLKEREAKKKEEEEAKKKKAEEKGYVVGSDLKMSASWNNGLLIQSANKDFKIHVGGRFDEDWVFFTQSDALQASPPRGVGDLQDGVFFRRARFRLDGSAWEVMEWNTEVNFENINLITFQDFWVGINQIPVVGTIRVGNNRVPQGLEAYTSENFNTFIERAAPFDAFLQNFNPGVFASNTALDQRLTWELLFHRVPAAGIPPTGFSGTNAGNNANSGADFGDGEYAATGRLTFLPYYEADGRYLVHLGSNYQMRQTKFDASTGRDVVQFRSRPEIFTGNGFVGVNNRFLDSGLIEGDHVQTVGAEFATVVGPFSVQAEYWLVGVNDAVSPPGRRGTALGDPTFQGGYVQASYLLTGESRTYDRRFGRFDRIRPFTNFWLVKTDDGCCTGWGAWEVAARYSVVDLNDTRVLVGTGGQLSEYTLGLNWYVNPNMRIQCNYVRANRNVAAPNVSGNVDEFGVRAHLDF